MWQVVTAAEEETEEEGNAKTKWWNDEMTKKYVLLRLLSLTCKMIFDQGPLEAPDPEESFT